MTGGQRWNTFWFARAPSDTLALVRVFLGLSCVLRFTGLYGFSSRLLAGKLDTGLPIHRFTEKTWRFSEIPVPLFDGAPTMTLQQYHWCEGAALLLGALFFVGLGSRVVGPLLGVVLLSTQLFDQAAFKHHIFTLGVACLLVGLSPSSDRFSLDALLGLKSGSTLRSVLPLRLIQTLISAIYLFSTLAKLNSSWFTGYLFTYTIGKDGLPADTFWGGIQHSWWIGAWWVVMCWATLFMEAFLVFAFWVQHLRPWAFAVGVVLHIGIELSLDVGSYSSTMIALYAAFLAPAARTLVLRYDPSSLRARVLAWLVRLFDWGARFIVVPGVPAQGTVDLLRRDGAIQHQGRGTLWQIARRLPLLQPLGLIGATLWAPAPVLSTRSASGKPPG